MSFLFLAPFWHSPLWHQPPARHQEPSSSCGWPSNAINPRHDFLCLTLLLRFTTNQDSRDLLPVFISSTIADDGHLVEQLITNFNSSPKQVIPSDYPETISYLEQAFHMLHSTASRCFLNTSQTLLPLSDKSYLNNNQSNLLLEVHLVRCLHVRLLPVGCRWDLDFQILRTIHAMSPSQFLQMLAVPQTRVHIKSIHKINIMIKI